MSDRRRDSKGRILRDGEYQEKNGCYTFRYVDSLGNRHVLRSWRLTEADVTPAGKKQKAPLRKLEGDLQVQVRKGVYPDELTVCELVERYIETKTGVTPNTRAGYKTVQNILDKEDFGRQKIDKIKYSDAKRWLIKLQSEDGRSYSAIQTIRGVVRPAFQMAVEDEELAYNPFNFELGKLLINDSIQRQALNPDQERKLLKFVQDDPHFCRYYEGIYVLLHTGLRIGEFCGLTKSDIDFKNHTITVNKQLQRTREGVYFISPTKTKSGTRVLPMQKDVEDCFKTIYSNRVSPKVEPMVDGVAGFLYLDQNGNPVLPLHWEHYFKRICNKYNEIYKVQMPSVTPHVCRHTYCTRMAKSGISVKTLQYLMGHSDVSVTLGVYTHSDLNDAQEELAHLEKRKTAVTK